jgi:hypothetical protein
VVAVLVELLEVLLVELAVRVSLFLAILLATQSQ